MLRVSRDLASPLVRGGKGLVWVSLVSLVLVWGCLGLGMLVQDSRVKGRVVLGVEGSVTLHGLSRGMIDQPEW